MDSGKEETWTAAAERKLVNVVCLALYPYELMGFMLLIMLSCLVMSLSLMLSDRLRFVMGLLQS